MGRVAGNACSRPDRLIEPTLVAVFPISTRREWTRRSRLASFKRRLLELPVIVVTGYGDVE